MNAIAAHTATQGLPLAAWLDLIDTVYPAHGAIVVGAGTGNGAWVQWLRHRQKQHVWLIEADESQCRHLLHHVPAGGDWTVRCGVVSDTPQPVTFYRASNPAESGLIPPQCLRALWPHLAETAVLESADTSTLNDLLPEAGQHLNWLFIDCLPAGRILQGASDTLDQLDVICVRVIANGYAQEVDETAQQAQVDTHLRARGFVCAQAQSERHPGLVQALYVRDPAVWRRQLAKRTREIDALAEQLHGLQRDKAELAEQVSQAQALAQERAQAIEAANATLQQLRSEKAALGDRLAQLEQQLAALAQARDEQAQQRQAAEQRLAEQRREIEAIKEELAKKATADQVLPSGLFSLPCHFDGVSMALYFNSAHPEWLRVEGDLVQYAAQSGVPLYLLSGEDGDFNVPPRSPQLPVEAGSAYQLSGRIAHAGGSRPQIWLFQYDGVKKLDSSSISVDETGYFRFSFQTLATTRSVAIGLRLADQGRILRSHSFVRLVEQGRVVAVEDAVRRLQDLEKLQRREMENAVRQIESFIRLQHYLGPDVLVPEVHHWPVSPDFGVLLIELVESHDYDAVIEFGSGTSTLLLAKALQRFAARQNRKGPAPLLSFDHLEHYQKKTQDLLARAGLNTDAQVVLAPLTPWQDDDGLEFAYYACEEPLNALKKRLPSQRTPRILIVVDGPPASTGAQARYPAMPMILSVLGASCHFDFLMDDYLRADEQAIIKRWEELLTKGQLAYKRTEFNHFEKKACLLEVSAADVKPQPSKKRKPSVALQKR